jgi:hypothetical protein
MLEKGVKDDQGRPDREQAFWVQASLVEALLGTGKTAEAGALRSRIAAEAPEPWMAETMGQQLGRLEQLLAAAPVV